MTKIKKNLTDGLTERKLSGNACCVFGEDDSPQRQRQQETLFDQKSSPSPKLHAYLMYSLTVTPRSGSITFVPGI